MRADAPITLDPVLVRRAAARAMARCDELARVTASATGIERTYLTPQHAAANALAAGWFREAGLRTRQDAAGNLGGRLDGADPEAPALVLGSHLDTVRDAGRFDGVLGVLMALEVVTLLRSHVPGWAHALEVVAFWDEEGTRFGTALLGSSALAGRWQEAWWDLRDADGVTLRQAFVDFGLDPAAVGDAARAPGSVAGYLEAHIEQGPELDRAGLPLAVVSSIASARRFEIEIAGEARHAGGTPYDARRDALLGASEVALAVERLCRDRHHVVGTVGTLETVGGAANVVPGDVRLSLDLRGELDETRDDVWRLLRAELDAVGGRRGLTWSARELHRAPAVACDPLLRDVLAHALPEGGQREEVTLLSRAGHDAMALAGLAPVGMLFLRNPDGISHHPDEGVALADVEAGLAAFAGAVARFADDAALRA